VVITPSVGVSPRRQEEKKEAHQRAAAQQRRCRPRSRDAARLDAAVQPWGRRRVPARCVAYALSSACRSTAAEEARVRLAASTTEESTWSQIEQSQRELPLPLPARALRATRRKEEAGVGERGEASRVKRSGCRYRRRYGCTSGTRSHLPTAAEGSGPHSREPLSPALEVQKRGLGHAQAEALRIPL
jgi:hypothetical protein